MKGINFIKQSGATGVIFLSLFLGISSASYSQRLDPPNRTNPIRSLLSKEHCTGSSGWTYGSSNLVSIGKQVFEPLAYIIVAPGKIEMISCRITRSENYKPSTLRLKFGIADTDDRYKVNSMQIKFYLDGQPQGSKTIIRGKLYTVPLDIENVSSVAIDIISSEQANYNSLYIVDASMLLGTIEENETYVSSPNDLSNDIIIENNIKKSHSLTPEEMINNTQNIIKNIDNLRWQIEETLKGF